MKKKQGECTPEDFFTTFVTSPSGARVLASLRQQFGGSTYVKGSPTDTVYREGSRRVLLFIEQVIENHKLNFSQIEEDTE